MTYPEIRLGAEHIAFCERIGRGRYASAVKRDLKHGAPKGEMAHIEGVLAECAAYLIYRPIVWSAYETRLDQPDLDDFIDVKWRGKTHHKLIVGEKGRHEWAYLLVCGSAHPLYRLIGWEWGEAAMQPKWLDLANHTPAYYLPESALRHPGSLLSEIRSRQAARSKGVAL
jgi:hypothetical protein